MSRDIRRALVIAGAIAVPALSMAQDLTQDQDLVDAAYATLASIQDDSFVSRREYCGMIGRNNRGELIITRPRAGQNISCRPKSFSIFRGPVEYLASYHTHGGYDPTHDREVPSLEDLHADADEDVIGFVATPGGRFWVTDPYLGEVRLICGPDCLPVDAHYDPTTEGTIRPRYTASQLRNRALGLDE